MQISDEWAMDEQIKSVLTGFRTTVIENPSFKRLYKGAQGIAKTFIWVMGSVSAFFLMMILCVLAGIINLVIVMEGGPVGGIQLVVGANQSAQIAFCVFLIVYGSIAGYAKRSELLVIGTITWFYYASVIGFYTLNGTIATQGWLATLYIFGFMFGIARVVVSQAERDIWRKKHAEALATFKAYRETVSGRTDHQSNP